MRKGEFLPFWKEDAARFRKRTLPFRGWMVALRYVQGRAGAVSRDMAVHRLGQNDTDIAALLHEAREEPLILQTESDGDFALLPLDDDVLDLLLERNPRFREECRQIRERMQQGDFLTYEQVLQALQENTSE